MDIVVKLQTTLLDYWKFLGILTLLLAFGFLAFSYIVTEINTSLYAAVFDNVDELCNLSYNTDFKYIKVINYEKSLNKAKIYCIYEDPAKNIELEMNFRNSKWQAFLTTKLNKENNFYWPIYT